MLFYRSSDPAAEPQPTGAALRSLPEGIGKKLTELEKIDRARIREIEVLLGIAA